ncbi:MAG: hypothetical protein QN130_12380 [Armatimonadota bacterium]|nr:hypothetical protein [Armatimonadota bacterium]
MESEATWLGDLIAVVEETIGLLEEEEEEGLAAAYRLLVEAYAMMLEEYKKKTGRPWIEDEEDEEA